MTFDSQENTKQQKSFSNRLLCSRPEHRLHTNAKHSKILEAPVNSFVEP